MGREKETTDIKEKKQQNIKNFLQKTNIETTNNTLSTEITITSTETTEEGRTTQNTIATTEGVIKKSNQYRSNII